MITLRLTINNRRLVLSAARWFWRAGSLLSFVCLLLDFCGGAFAAEPPKPVNPANAGAVLTITNPISRPAAPVRANPIVRFQSTPPLPTQVAPQPAPPVDPLVTLLQQQPPIDTESPVVAQAKVDPPIARVGGYIVYRLSLNALNNSVKLPEALPLPAGLTARPPTRGEILMQQNAKMGPQTSINYQLEAASNGTYTIPAFELEVYGKRVPVPAATFQVVAANSSQGRDALRLEFTVPTGNVYVGQCVRVSFRLADTNAPNFIGFMQGQVIGELVMVDQELLRQRRMPILINGRNFNIFTSENNVFPMKAGVLELRAQVHALEASATPGTEFYLISQLIESSPAILNAIPVPQKGRLPGYTGLIGEFQVDQPKLNAAEVRAGDPVVLSAAIQGEGNFQYIAPPKNPRVPGWQIQSLSVDPTIVYVNAAATAARRMFKYTLIPLDDRASRTPPILFASFNPKTQKYEDLTIPSVPIHVLPAPPGTVMPVVPPEEPEESQEPEEPALSTIVEAMGSPAASLRPLQQRPWFLGLQMAIGLGIFAFWGWRKRQLYLAEHPEILVRRAARRALLQRLTAVRRAAQAKDPAAFAMRCAEALKEAAAPDLEAAPQALAAPDVLAELIARDPRNRDAVLVREIFNAADNWRFARRAPPEEILSRLPEVEQLLRELLRRI